LVCASSDFLVECLLNGFNRGKILWKIIKLIN
jgi:hypothetical protein